MVLNSGRNGKLKMTQSRIWSVAAAAVGFAISAMPALAQDSNEVLGAPHDKGIGLQAPATVLAEEIDFLHNVILMPIITVITLFVLGLLFIVWFRFRESKNPVPSKNTHNTGLEVAWTIVPALILVVIAVFSFPRLYQQLEIPTPGLTIRAIGHQWYWAYEYPDNGNFTFDARVVRKEDLQQGQIYLLDTDNEVVLPIDTDIRIQITGFDVIHAWTVPAFGVKHDAVPGRTNESWFNIKKPGIYYGQCSELCGVEHAYMPIKVRAVTKEEYQAWVTEAQQKFAKVDGTEPESTGAQDVAAAE
jgi:cytochrome c oxidase subunit II